MNDAALALVQQESEILILSGTCDEHFTHMEKKNSSTCQNSHISFWRPLIRDTAVTPSSQRLVLTWNVRETTYPLTDIWQEFAIH